jgi:hypothetical protein
MVGTGAIMHALRDVPRADHNKRCMHEQSHCRCAVR